MAAIEPGPGGDSPPSLVTLLLIYLDGGSAPFDAAQFALKAYARFAADTWAQSGLG